MQSLSTLDSGIITREKQVKTKDTLYFAGCLFVFLLGLERQQEEEQRKAHSVFLL